MKRFVLVRRDNYPEGGAYVVACSILKAVQRFNVPIADSYVERGRVIIETDGEKKDVGGIGVLPPFLHGLWQNYLLRVHLRDGDVLIAENGISLLLPRRLKKIVYVHHSFAFRYIDDMLWKPALRKAANLAAALVFFCVEMLQHPDVLMFNSRYSLKRGGHMRARKGKTVLYPPVPMPATVPAVEKHVSPIVSLGRIHPEKRHWLQLEMARRFPQYEFVIIGFGYKGDPYVQHFLEQAAALPNVTVKMNCSDREIEEYLSGARIFLHTMRGEHFGIAIAQAAAHGCTILLHRRGGAPEIAPAATLLWEDVDELENALRRAAQDSAPQPSGREEIAEKFSTKKFEESFYGIVSNALAT